MDGQTDGRQGIELRLGWRPLKRDSRVAGVVLVAVAIGLVAALLLWGQLLVFAVGAAIAFFLLPVVDWLHAHGWPRAAASLVVVLATVAASVALAGAVAAILVDQGTRFVADLPRYIDELESWYAGLVLPSWLRGALDALVASASDGAATMDQDAVMGGLAGTMLGTLGSLFAWLLLPVFLFFLLKDQPVMAAAFYARLPQAWRRDVRRVLVITIGDLLRYLKAELLIGSLMLLIVTLGMVGIGTLMDAPLLVRFAILLGLIALVLELIPQIGPILSCLPALMLAFPTGVDVVIAVSLFYFVAFNVEGSILVPTFQGRANHFSGAVVLVIVTTGFALAGMIGAALALPLASLVRDLLRLREHAGPRPASAPANPQGIRVRAVGEVS